MLKWKVPVTVVTGYLGSGKTTLLKRIIEGSDRRMAVLMNEFGEIGVDSKVLKGSNVDMVELLGGCVCCSLTGEFEAAVREILEKVKPEMIVVETTGVAEPDALILNLGDMEGVRLDSVVTVVDADAFLRFPSTGHTGRVQIENADLIILNKVDLVGAGDIPRIESALRQLNPRALIVKATYANVDTGILFGFDVERRVEPHGHHDLSTMESFVYRSDRVHSKPMFAAFLLGMPREIYRSKGQVRFPDGMYMFSYVNGRHELSRTTGVEETEIVFIGDGIKKFEGRVLDGLKGCLV